MKPTKPSYPSQIFQPKPIYSPTLCQNPKPQTHHKNIRKYTNSQQNHR